MFERELTTKRLRRLARLFEEDEAKKSREIEGVLKKLEKLEENLDGSKKELSDLEAEIERSELQRGEESWNLEECFKNEDDKIFGKRHALYCIVSVCMSVLLVWALIPGSTGSETTFSGALTADFVYYPSNPTTADAINFTDRFTSALGRKVAAWYWDFDGDGVKDSGQQNPTYSFPEEGAHVVTLTVVDERGSIASVDKSITVSAVSSEHQAHLQSLPHLLVIFSLLLSCLLVSQLALRVSSAPIQSRPHTVANSMTPLPIGGRGPDLTRNEGGKI